MRDDVELLATDASVTEIDYPAERYPQKITSFNLDKNPLVEGVLEAIKGKAALPFDTGVINIRKYSGYLVSVTTES